VTAADTGRPIRGANVNINATIGTPPSSGPLAGQPIGALARGRATANASVAFVSRQALTDNSGRFSIERLPAAVVQHQRQPPAVSRRQLRPAEPGGQGTAVSVGEGRAST